MDYRPKSFSPKTRGVFIKLLARSILSSWPQMVGARETNLASKSVCIRSLISFQMMGFWVKIYLVVHPTDRFCGLVHPSYVCLNIAPTYLSHEEIPRVNIPPQKRSKWDEPPSRASRLFPPQLKFSSVFASGFPHLQHENWPWNGGEISCKPMEIFGSLRVFSWPGSQTTCG